MIKKLTLIFILQISFAKGMLPSHWDPHNLTPEHLCGAAWEGELDLVKLLIDTYGLDPNSQFSRSANHRTTAVHRAAIQGYKEMVIFLLEKGAHADLLDDDHDTPLFRAARAGHADIAQILLEYGANVNIQNNEGNRPLNVACINGSSEVVPILLKAGANINAPGNEGRTPLQDAIACGYKDTIGKLLRKAGAQK